MDYKEKLEEAKELYNTANADQKYALELLFPEIKENEEERIRKTLIEYFNAYPKEYFGGLKKSYIVAWLGLSPFEFPVMTLVQRNAYML